MRSFDAVEQLSTLKGLQILNLRQTAVTDLKPLASLTNLRSLDVRGCKIARADLLELNVPIALANDYLRLESEAGDCVEFVFEGGCLLRLHAGIKQPPINQISVDLLNQTLDSQVVLSPDSCTLATISALRDLAKRSEIELECGFAFRDNTGSPIELRARNERLHLYVNGETSETIEWISFNERSGRLGSKLSCPGNDTWPNFGHIAQLHCQ